MAHVTILPVNTLHVVSPLNRVLDSVNLIFLAFNFRIKCNLNVVFHLLLDCFLPVLMLDPNASNENTRSGGDCSVVGIHIH